MPLPAKNLSIDFHFRISKKMAKLIKALAKDNDESSSEFVRNILIKYFTRKGEDV